MAECFKRANTDSGRFLWSKFKIEDGNKTFSSSRLGRGLEKPHRLVKQWSLSSAFISGHLLEWTVNCFGQTADNYILSISRTCFVYCLRLSTCTEYCTVSKALEGNCRDVIFLQEEERGEKQAIVLYHDLHTIMPITQSGPESALCWKARLHFPVREEHVPMGSKQTDITLKGQSGFWLTTVRSEILCCIWISFSEIT